jgi:hypothetical protein
MLGHEVTCLEEGWDFSSFDSFVMIHNAYVSLTATRCIIATSLSSFLRVLDLDSLPLTFGRVLIATLTPLHVRL